MTRPRKLYVKSFGCQMNVYDSHRMADTLAPEGFAETLNAGDADIDFCPKGFRDNLSDRANHTGAQRQPRGRCHRHQAMT